MCVKGSYRDGSSIDCVHCNEANINTDRDPLLVEREKTHGAFKNVAETAQRLKFVIRDTNRKLAKPQEEALDLICTKIARILHGNYMTKDHWDDIAGYAKLGAEACQSDYERG